MKPSDTLRRNEGCRPGQSPVGIGQRDTDCSSETWRAGAVVPVVRTGRRRQPSCYRAQPVTLAVTLPKRAGARTVLASRRVRDRVASTALRTHAGTDLRTVFPSLGADWLPPGRTPIERCRHKRNCYRRYQVRHCRRYGSDGDPSANCCCDDVGHDKRPPTRSCASSGPRKVDRIGRVLVFGASEHQLLPHPEQRVMVGEPTLREHERCGSQGGVISPLTMRTLYSGASIMFMKSRGTGSSATG